MNPYLESWNTLETIGPKGNAFKQRKDYLAPAGRNLMRYASLGGLCLSILSLAMVMM